MLFLCLRLLLPASFETDCSLEFILLLSCVSGTIIVSLFVVMRLTEVKAEVIFNYKSKQLLVSCLHIHQA